MKGKPPMAHLGDGTSWFSHINIFPYYVILSLNAYNMHFCDALEHNSSLKNQLPTNNMSISLQIRLA